MLKEMSEQEKEAIVAAHHAHVVAYATNFVHNSDLAKDVAQDVFIRLFLRKDGIPQEPHLSRWLIQVTKHRSIDYIRKEENIRVYHGKMVASNIDKMELSPWVKVFPDYSPAPMSEETVEWKQEKIALVMSLLGTLPPSMQRVFKMQLVEGLTGAQIARKTKQSAGGVGRLLWEGTRRLRARLEKIHEYYP